MSKQVYGVGVVVEDGYRLLPDNHMIRDGDMYLDEFEGEWKPCLTTVGMAISETGFVAVERREDA